LCKEKNKLAKIRNKKDIKNTLFSLSLFANRIYNRDQQFSYICSSAKDIYSHVRFWEMNSNISHTERLKKQENINNEYIIHNTMITLHNLKSYLKSIEICADFFDSIDIYMYLLHNFSQYDYLKFNITNSFHGLIIDKK